MPGAYIYIKFVGERAFCAETRQFVQLKRTVLLTRVESVVDAGAGAGCFDDMRREMRHTLHYKVISL
jgi:hypothetical protein